MLESWSLEDELFLFRGTTYGWPGNPCLQEQRLTCVTTDPIVATLFAIECRSQGPGIILLAPMLLYDSFRGPINHHSVEECALNLAMSPSEFASQAVATLEVSRSMEILAELGHVWLPPRINGRDALRFAIDESNKENLRLNLDEIRTFNRLALGVR